MATTATIAEIVDRIVRRFDPDKIILFGSQARGDARPDSDIDLLVVLPQCEDKHEATVAILSELRDSAAPVDIVVTSPDEIGRFGDLVGTVLRPALREGIVLYMSNRNRDNVVRRWIRYAEGDLQTAEAALSADSPPRNTCFLAQQCAEKALKAILVFLQVDFPHVHNLETISNLIPDGWSTRIEHPDLGKLTAWAVESRYPGEGIEPTETDAEAAVRMARAVLDSVLRDLAQHGFDTTRG